MSKYMTGQVLAFAGEDGDDIGRAGIAVEMTDVSDDGRVELAFDAPWKKGLRIYLKVSLSEVVRLATTKEPSP